MTEPSEHQQWSREDIQSFMEVLRNDIAIFGPAGNDLDRLKKYQEELDELDHAETK